VPEDEPVRIVPYDPIWPGRFDDERSALTVAIGDWAIGGIHHVGSTSVPGLEAKPIIDILVGVGGLEESRSCFNRLAALGYPSNANPALSTVDCESARRPRRSTLGTRRDSLRVASLLG
jgi:GrpB-like predicted nucleotidyltransferase (UPF0157 family)